MRLVGDYATQKRVIPLYETGDIVFIRGRSWISKVIKWLDKGEFSHVAMFVSDNEIIEAEYSTRVRVVPFKYGDYEVIRLNLNGEQKKSVTELSAILEGKRYDFVQIIILLFTLLFGIKGLSKFRDTKEVICSELVGLILDELGIGEGDMVSYTPNELYVYLSEQGYYRHS